MSLKCEEVYLKGGTLVLYDVTSSYFEGRSCSLAFFGHNRDKKKGKKQIVYGLLCSTDGCPVAVEVFCGNTGDPRRWEFRLRRFSGALGLITWRWSETAG